MPPLSFQGSNQTSNKTTSGSSAGGFQLAYQPINSGAGGGSGAVLWAGIGGVALLMIGLIVLAWRKG